MTILHRLSFAPLLLGLLLMASHAAEAETASTTFVASDLVTAKFVVDTDTVGDGSNPVAIVCWISGNAKFLKTASSRAKTLSVLDRLPSGAIVRTDEGAQVMLVFLDGERYVLGSGSKIRVGRRGVKIDAGSVQRLESVPAVAQLPRLAKDQKPGKRPAAGRIRQARFAPRPTFELYPHDQATLLHDAPVLHFRALSRVERYEVEVRDIRGRDIYSVEMDVRATAANRGSKPSRRRTHRNFLDTVRVEIPEGVLVPETVYHLRVSSGSMGRQILHGDTLFTTASRRDARARHHLARQAAATDDPGLLMLLADVDYRLGLWREACDSLARLAIHEPNQSAWTEVKERFECDERS